MIVTFDKYSKITWTLNSILIIWGICQSVNILFILVCIEFNCLICYSYREVEQRSLLFSFGISFFVFLLGRDFLEIFFKYNVETAYSNETNNHTYLCFILSLSGLWLAYVFAERMQKQYSSSIYTQIDMVEDEFPNIVRRISKYLFFSSAPFAIVTRTIIALYVLGNGYQQYYNSDLADQLYSSNTILYIIGRLENVMPAALGIFFATIPNKTESKSVIITYVVYLLLSLGCGSRGTCLLGFLFLFVVFAWLQSKRPEEKWFDRKLLIYAVLFVPFIAIAMTIYGNVRFNTSYESTSLFSNFIDFFYDEGTSITVIKHAYEMADEIPKQRYLLDFLHSGILARLLGIEVYHGNTVQNALHGASFQHALSYVVMGSMYLSGRGTGTCFIAELYYDLGYFGVVAGSMLYGWIFQKISNTKSNNLFIRSCIFIVITKFLWAPRGPFNAYLSFLEAPTTIGSFVLIWAVSNFIYHGHLKL